MISCTGIGINDFIAVGKAKVVKNRADNDYPKHAKDSKEQLKRIDEAQTLAKEQLQQLHDDTEERAGAQEALIFEIHQMMLEDAEFTEIINSEIKDHKASAEHAVILARDKFSAMLASLEDEYMSQRANDVLDISNRLLDCLNQEKNSKKNTKSSDVPIIICAVDLLPSQVVSMDLNSVAAIALAKGSRNSHASILANSLGISCVVNLGDVFKNAAESGDAIIVDGKKGEVVLNPDEETLLVAKKHEKIQNKRLAHLQKLKGTPAVTKDGYRIELAANIGGPDEVAGALAHDAESIGLFRSEFIYIGRKQAPSEDEQFRIYKKILEKMKGKRVVVRTLDIGSDKSEDYFNLDKEENPALGLRAIRLCFSREDLLEKQLRALYRASAFGKLAIMFPMIANVWEIERLIKICNSAKRDLESGGIDYSKDVELGIMIETPAAAIMADKFAQYVDFFSVGTNDLTQYTLACDRQNPKLLPFCDTHHDAVLYLIERAAKYAHKHGAWIGICGELANDASLTKRFLRMGIDELSMAPAHILRIKDIIINTDLSETKKRSTKSILKSKS